MSRKQKLRKYLGTQDHSRPNDPVQKNFIPFPVQYQMLGLSVLAFLAYFNSLTNQFVNDDITGIQKNPAMGNLFAMASNNWFYLPFALIRFITFKIGGLDPLAFHLVNIPFHIGNVNLIFLILNLISGNLVAIFVAAIFAVHPILSESVTWISGGPYSTYSFFFLLSFYLFLKFRSVKTDLISWLSCYISIATNPLGIMLAPILTLWVFLQPKENRTWLRLIPFWILSLIGFLINLLWALPQRAKILSSTGPLIKVNLFVQIPTAISQYLKLIFWPAGLTLFHTLEQYGWDSFWHTTTSIIVFFVFLGLIIWTSRQQKLVCFWLLFFLLALLPTLNQWGVNWIVAERYVYLGALGIISAVFIFASGYLAKLNHKLLFFILTLIVSGLAIRTWIRNQDWQDEIHLYTSAEKYSPDSPFIHADAANAYLVEGFWEQGEAEAKTSLSLAPTAAGTWYLLGESYRARGRYQEAEQAYLKGIKVDPKYWGSYLGLAETYAETGNQKNAIEMAQKTVELAPNEPYPQYVLNDLLTQKQQP